MLNIYDHSVIECDVLKLYVSFFRSYLIINPKEIILFKFASVKLNVLKYCGSILINSVAG